MESRYARSEFGDEEADGSQVGCGVMVVERCGSRGAWRSQGEAWRPQGSPLLYPHEVVGRRIVVATLAVAMHFIIVISRSVVMPLEMILLCCLMSLFPTGGIITDVFSFLFQFEGVTNDVVIITALPDVSGKLYTSGTQGFDVV